MLPPMMGAHRGAIPRRIYLRLEDIATAILAVVTRPFHQRALFIRLFWGFERYGNFFANCTGKVLSTPGNKRLFIAFHFPGLKEAKNAEAYRAIAAGCVPNDDFINGG